MTTRSHLRLVGRDEVNEPRALGYTSRRGVMWYLHRGTTKTGKPKYFVAKAVGAGALLSMPAGFAFSESINGVVAVRKLASSGDLRAEDVERVEREVRRHRHLSQHRVERTAAAIVLHALVGAELAAVDAAALRRRGMSESTLERLTAKRRYEPVMRFVPTGARAGEYRVERMTYRGQGGWHGLATGGIETLAATFVGLVGTERFFELW